MKPTAAEIENGMPRSHSASDAAGQRERHGAEHEQRVAARCRVRVTSSRKISEEAARHHDHQALPRGGEVLELSAPRQPIARPAGGPAASILRLRLGHERGDVAPAHVGLHDDAPLAVLAADLVGPFGQCRTRATWLRAG